MKNKNHSKDITRRHKDTKNTKKLIKIFLFSFVAANRRFDVYSVPL
jgi:hypothetical protein